MNTFVKSDPEKGVHLDSPNVYRILELVVHTLPTYGHINHVSEQVYEHKQSEPKKAHNRGKNDYDDAWVVESQSNNETDMPIFHRKENLTNVVLINDTSASYS